MGPAASRTRTGTATVVPVRPAALPPAALPSAAPLPAGPTSRPVTLAATAPNGGPAGVMAVDGSPTCGLPSPSLTGRSPPEVRFFT